MFSVTCKTAIKAVIYLAARNQTGIYPRVKEISDFIHASEHTVGKLLQTLVKQGIIKSVKGRTGGFYVAGEQLQIPLIKIVEAIDGKEIFKECGLGLSTCSSKKPCPIHEEFKLVRNSVEKLCKEKKISELSEPVNNGMMFLKR